MALCAEIAPMSEILFTDPTYTERGDGSIIAPSCMETGEQDQWRGWNLWLKNNLLIERDLLLRAFGEALGELEAKRDAEIRKLELKLAECAGAVDVLRTGKTMRVRGTFNVNAEYKQFDIVAVDGSSFIALEDRPGRCPGEHWQLLASAGKRGGRGPVGPKGEQGEPGLSAPAMPYFKGFHADPKTYTLSIITSDGHVHALSLRGLFQQFFNETRGKR
jgi:hypothetical protein